MQPKHVGTTRTSTWLGEKMPRLRHWGQDRSESECMTAARALGKLPYHEMGSWGNAPAGCLFDVRGSFYNTHTIGGCSGNCAALHMTPICVQDTASSAGGDHGNPAPPPGTHVTRKPPTVFRGGGAGSMYGSMYDRMYGSGHPRAQWQECFIDRLTFSKRRGLFVEIGAGNGEREASRTLMLEHARSWQGLLIEPDPVAFFQGLLRRRGGYAVNACVSATVDHRRFANSEGGVSYWADCYSLRAILGALPHQGGAASPPHIDFVSINVAGGVGAEDILASMDLESSVIDAIGIQVEQHQARQVEALMQGASPFCCSCGFVDGMCVCVYACLVCGVWCVLGTCSSFV